MERGARLLGAVVSERGGVSERVGFVEAPPSLVGLGGRGASSAVVALGAVDAVACGRVGQLEL